MSAETDIRALITRWVEAVANMDLDGVVSSHSDDIVMFDVPPPYDGVRGIAAYRESWPPFFDFVRSGAIFELVELHVEAGTDVAIAHGLLRCGDEQSFQENPDNRLRLTMGLRRITSDAADDAKGEWEICHEHHSFPDAG